MSEVVEFRTMFNRLYQNLYGNLPEEGDPGYLDMCMSFMLAWAVYREATKKQDER